MMENLIQLRNDGEFKINSGRKKKERAEENKKGKQTQLRTAKKKTRKGRQTQLKVAKNM